MAKSDVLVRMKADTSGYDANIAKARKQLEKFKQENLSAGGAMKQMSSSLVGMAAKFASFGAAAGAAMKVVKDAFMASESGIDSWGRAMESAKASYDVFLQTLNGGNWSNFFANISDAVRGARDLYDAFDRLGSIKNNNKAAIALLEQRLSQLRLLQQAGEDVSKQIESTAKSLAALRGQGVEAGKNAGVTGISETIRRALNASGGRDIGDNVVNAVVWEITHQGQNAFDKYKNTYNVLRQRGTKRVQKYDEAGTPYMDSVWNIRNLSASDRRKYLLAKAITERESALSPYIDVFASSVGEETAANQKTFRYNRYALQGTRGGGKGGRAGIPEYIPLEGSIDAQIAKVQQLEKAWRAAADDDSRRRIYEELEKAQYILDVMSGKGIKAPDLSYGVSDLAPVGTKRGNWQLDENAMDAVNNLVESFNKKSEDMMETAQKATNGLAQVTDGLRQMGIKLPDGVSRVIGAVQGLISVIQGAQAIIDLFSTSTAATQVASQAANTTALAALTTAVTANTAALYVNTATPFANGGIVRAAAGFMVPGSRYSGDNIPALLNSGEIVMNRAQQGNLASQLQENRNSRPQLAQVSGEQLYIAMNAYLRRSGRGELVTWK